MVGACARAVSQRPLAVPPSSRPVSTALRRQGRVVARAAGHATIVRLRHEARRRGAASAASGPPARARVVTKVRQSAQPPADRSVQWLIQRRRWTAPHMAGLPGDVCTPSVVWPKKSTASFSISYPQIQSLLILLRHSHEQDAVDLGHDAIF